MDTCAFDFVAPYDVEVLPLLRFLLLDDPPLDLKLAFGDAAKSFVDPNLAKAPKIDCGGTVPPLPMRCATWALVTTSKVRAVS